MAKKAYVGVSNVAKNIKKMYVGVNGVARKVKKGYIGVANVARLFFAPGGDLHYSSSTTLSFARCGAMPCSNDNYAIFAGGFRYNSGNYDLSTGGTESGQNELYDMVDAFNSALTRYSATALPYKGHGNFGVYLGSKAVLNARYGQIVAYDTSLVQSVRSTTLSGASDSDVYGTEFNGLCVSSSAKSLETINESLTVTNIVSAYANAAASYFSVVNPALTAIAQYCMVTMYRVYSSGGSYVGDHFRRVYDTSFTEVYYENKWNFTAPFPNNAAASTPSKMLSVKDSSNLYVLNNSLTASTKRVSNVTGTNQAVTVGEKAAFTLSESSDDSRLLLIDDSLTTSYVAGPSGTFYRYCRAVLGNKILYASDLTETVDDVNVFTID